MGSEYVLEMSKLSAWYDAGGGFFAGKRAKRQVLREISFNIGRGEVLGVVGESGCGKSTLAKAVLGIVKDTQGAVVHHTQRPQMVFQDPYGSLNPVKRIGWTLEEPLKIAGGYAKEERRRRALEMLARVGLDESYAGRLPRNMSGGQRQRVSIAASLMLGSEFIVLDEPVSSLDVTIQAQIIRLLLDLKDDLGLSYMFISHDLNIIYQMCDRVAVMKNGEVVELGEADEIFNRPRHDYTKQLLAASLDL